MPAAASTMPAVTSGRGPVRGSSSAEDMGPVAMMAATCGRKANPVSTGE